MPDLTTNDPEKLKDAGGPIAIENTTAEYHTHDHHAWLNRLLQKGQIWVGTDDGNLQVTTDGGKNWNNLIQERLGRRRKFSGVARRAVAHECAELATCRFDRHMFDDFRPYIYKTTDGGKSGPASPATCPRKLTCRSFARIRRTRTLLYAGTEIGLFASYNGGREWIPLNLKNMPNVAVHDIVVHPRENDLILATHGRSIWILRRRDAVMQQMTSTDRE